MNLLKKVVDKLFLVREIFSKIGEPHFRRWRIIKYPFIGGGIYLHRLLKSDQDAHCHDHPWDFTSLILYGGYVEYYPDKPAQIFLPLQVNSKKAEEYHKIDLVHGSTYTLVFMGPKRRPWGYSVNGKWIENSKYRVMKNSGAFNEVSEDIYKSERI